MTMLASPLFAVILALLVSWALPAHAELGDCGQPQSTGDGPKSGDALAALRHAVGSDSACDQKPCICDATGDGSVTASDAQRILRNAVGQDVPLECPCDECVTLGEQDSPGLATRPVAGAEIGVKQVLIEARFIGIHSESYDELGLEAEWMLSSPLVTDKGPRLGGTNGDGRLLAVDSNATGGPPDLSYLLYPDHRPEGALPILNKMFVSPFMSVKTFPLLPTDRCVLFAPGTFVEPSLFPGGDPVQNLEPVLPAGLVGDVLYDRRAPASFQALLNAIAGDNRNDILQAPSVVVRSGQSFLHMADDVEPDLASVVADFRDRIQQVTFMPFGIFTGPVMDVVPTVAPDNRIDLEIRLGGEMATFFFSTAFEVDGVAVDAEIPLHRRSRVKTTVTVDSGQTVVLGGLMLEGNKIATRGLPFLDRIPVIGSAFTHKHFKVDKQSLLILITPTIVENN